MGNILKRDPEHTKKFFERHHALLVQCSRTTNGLGTHLTPAGRTLVQEARTYFGYARSTIDHDILRALRRHFSNHGQR